jgi:hypothetical protein
VLKRGPGVRGDGDIGLEGEALQASTARLVFVDDGGRGAQPADRVTGPRPASDPLLDGGGGITSQQRMSDRYRYQHPRRYRTGRRARLERGGTTVKASSTGTMVMILVRPDVTGAGMFRPEPFRRPQSFNMHSYVPCPS